MAKAPKLTTPAKVVKAAKRFPPKSTGSVYDVARKPKTPGTTKR